MIILAPGRSFGDGAHETTQLCLLAIGYLTRGAEPDRMIDFGSGNGVLAIAAAGRGWHVEAVEIDPRALDEARHNASLNGVGDRIELRAELSAPPAPHPLVVANILLDVLLAYAHGLTSRVASAGHLVLSGLSGTDVPAILAEYRPRLAGHRPAVFARGQWRAVVFSPAQG